MLGGDTIGIIAAGLPNIEGGITLDDPAKAIATGAFAFEGKRTDGPYNENGTTYNVSFNASRSNSIYGSSSTVQPPAISLFPQIKY